MAIGDLSKNKAPRTFEVMQRQQFEQAGRDLMQGLERAEQDVRRGAAEGMIEAVRGQETGGGTRVASYRRAAQEMLPQFTQQQLLKGQTELDLIAQRGEMGDISSDRMLKMTTYEDLIQKMWDEGKDAQRIGDTLMAYYNNEPDPVIQQYLLDRARGYGGQIGEFKKQQASEQRSAKRAADAAKVKAAFSEYMMTNPDNLSDEDLEILEKSQGYS